MGDEPKKKGRGGDVTPPVAALNSAMPEFYAELKALAARLLHRERRSHTLHPTALVNEVYLRLADQEKLDLSSRAEFFTVAASMIRRVLIDHARKRAAQKRSGNGRVTLTGLELIDKKAGNPIDVVVLDDALNRLAEMHPRAARIVELRFFGGLGVDDTAEVVEASPRTVANDWVVARAWLRRELGGHKRK